MIILITGASHTGKTLLAQRMLEQYKYELFSLITPELYELLGCKGVLTKAPIFAVERIKAIRKAGFTKSEHMLIGKAGFAYDGYWTIK